MTEPHAGADPTMFTTRAVRDGDEWVIDGWKFFSSNAKTASFLIVMAVTDPDVSAYQGMSMFLVPTDTPGVEIVRNVGLAGEGADEGSHALIHYRDVHVPADALLGGEGQAFAIAQTRLGGGRIHHAMRTIGLATKALDMMCERALSRRTQGSLLADKQFVQGYIADSYTQLLQFRLLVLYVAWSIDRHNDYRKVRKDIAAVKVVMPGVLHDIAMRAMQVHGALGVSNEMPFHRMVMTASVLGLADGPTEVHKVTVARQVLRGHRATDDLWPSEHLPKKLRGGTGEVRRVPRTRGGEPVSDAASGARVPEGDRLARLTAWLDRNELGVVGAPLQTRFLSGGSQNEIFELRRDGLHGAMRIPPPSAPADRDRGILREWRILQALGGSDVPHTEAIGVCTDPSVLGRPFYVMDFVDGWSPMELHGGAWPPPFDDDHVARQGLAYELVEGIARLSTLDWRGRGLGDLGRPDGFHERQVDRWTAFLDRIKGRELPGFDEASAWLRSHRPIDYVPGIMHGDYQFANVMYRHGAPARLAAIVDWEMGTVGDPKLDLAWVVAGWPHDTTPRPRHSAGGYVDMTHMPSRDEVLGRYSQVSGRQVDDIDYYVVLARWKLAIVLEQGYQRAGPDSPALEAFGPIVLDSMRAAADLAESTDYR